MKNLKSFIETPLGKVVIFIVSSIIIPIVVNWVNNTFLNFELFGKDTILTYIALCLIWVFVLTIIVFMVKFLKYLIAKRMTYSDTNNIITEISEKYMFKSNEKNLSKEIETIKRQMFALASDNDQSRMHISKKPLENIIYYSFSAKKYLNWIDFVYLRYLKELKEKLHCKIVIDLHYPDEIKECKIEKKENDKKDIIVKNRGKDANPNNYESKFLQIVEYFSTHIKKIIGNDVIIKCEQDYYKKYSYKFVDDFHFVYIAYSLYYANLIGSEVNGKKFGYEQYKRKLSHIESAFPIWMMSEKKMGRRIYILDNKLSNEIWQLQPLKGTRESNEIYFIEVSDLNNELGNRLNVHKEGNCINLSDDSNVIKSKIKMLDSAYEKQMMINLLMDYHAKDNERDKLSGSILKDDCIEINGDEIDTVLEKLLTQLINEYDIKPAKDELKKYGLK